MSYGDQIHKLTLLQKVVLLTIIRRSTQGFLNRKVNSLFVKLLHPKVGIHLSVDVVQPYSVDNREFTAYVYK